MATKKGLVIVHVDGLGYEYLQKALELGRMPFVRELMEREGYKAEPYRCGIPSTTPFAQAGIIYGDNSEIPSFRWWDKQSGILVEFGGLSTFRRVEHKYFEGCHPLTEDGACIAACYPGGAAETFGLGYEERNIRAPGKRHSLGHILASWASNPLNIIAWAARGLVQIGSSNLEYWRTRVQGRPAANPYVVSDMLEEIFLHEVTRFATVQAMQEDYPTIYSGFYAYDETAHAYGPGADYSLRILGHVDNTIRRVAQKRHMPSRDYELIVLSDHGQVETVPYDKQIGRRLGEVIAEWLPTFEVDEFRGKKITPKNALDGHIVLTYSGGLAHLYFKEICPRLERREIGEHFPDLLTRLANAEGVAFILLRDGPRDVILGKEKDIAFGDGTGLDSAARDFLSRFDDPDVLARQLHKLNSFERSGDIIIVGDYVDGRQINFENQVGGHGSVGGQQLHPFVLAKPEWGIDTSRVEGASDLYPLLKNLRDHLLKSGG